MIAQAEACDAGSEACSLRRYGTVEHSCRSGRWERRPV